MTAAFDDLNFQDLVHLLTEEEQQALRPVVLRLVASHTDASESARPTTQRSNRHLSFAGTVEASPEFASTSEDVLRRELGGS